MLRSIPWGFIVQRLGRSAKGKRHCAVRAGSTLRQYALGSAVSPLCCNAYLHRLDWELARQRWALVRYADDFVVCCANRDQARQAKRLVEEALAGLKLRLEPAKTRLTSFDRGFDFLGVRYYRDTYSFPWEGKRVEVEGPVPAWLWGYMPDRYE